MDGMRERQVSEFRSPLSFTGMSLIDRYRRTNRHGDTKDRCHVMSLFPPLFPAHTHS